MHLVFLAHCWFIAHTRWAVYSLTHIHTNQQEILYPKILQNTIEQLEHLRHNNIEICLTKVKSHRDINPNEIADKLAKRGANASAKKHIKRTITPQGNHCSITHVCPNPEWDRKPGVKGHAKDKERRRRFCRFDNQESKRMAPELGLATTKGNAQFTDLLI